MRFALLIVVASACADAPAPEAIEARKSDGCGAHESGCGENGAIVDDKINLSWLQPDHTPANGVTYKHFATTKANLDAGPPFADNLDVYNPLFPGLPGNALRYGDASYWHTGADLIGTAFRIERDGKPYDITIVDVHNDLAYWTQLPSGTAESYRFEWTTVDEIPERRGEVCPYPDEPLYLHGEDAVVFEGEQYDPTTRVITATTAGNLYTDPFNVACAHGLPYKQQMTRRTSSTATPYFNTTIANDRTAEVHVWAAEYCGAGAAFTHQSHKLRVRDKRNWLPFGAPSNWTPADEALPNFRYEAVWNADGAVCLDTPRLAVGDPIVPADRQIWTEIREACDAKVPKKVLPKCTGQSWFPLHWQEHGAFLTATIAPLVVSPP